eukprot:147373-Chlamydomonas_euryale.AAC.1
MDGSCNGRMDGACNGRMDGACNGRMDGACNGRMDGVHGYCVVCTACLHTCEGRTATQAPASPFSQDRDGPAHPQPPAGRAAKRALMPE